MAGFVYTKPYAHAHTRTHAHTHTKKGQVMTHGLCTVSTGFYRGILSLKATLQLHK